MFQPCVLDFIGLCKTNEIKILQKTQALPARPPPNKFEGATLYSINNAKLNNIHKSHDFWQLFLFSHHISY